MEHGQSLTVPGVALAAHAVNRAGLGAQMPEALRCELRAAVHVNSTPGGLRLSRVRRTVPPERSASRRSPSDQPTILRENRPAMATRKRKPPMTGRYVVSATQIRFGGAAEKSRCRRLGPRGSL